MYDPARLSIDVEEGEKLGLWSDVTVIKLESNFKILGCQVFKQVVVFIEYLRKEEGKAW